MRKCRIIFRSLVCLLGLAAVLAAAGCDRSEPPPRQPKVIHQKIAVPQAKAAKPAVAPRVPAAKVKPAPEKASTALYGGAAMANIKPYNPAGKVDPFEPLFRKKESVGPRPMATVKRKKRIPRTPLEKVDLSQLKLTAIIRAPEGNKALVEESSGKGYIISKGTYIGNHGGRVEKILPDRVIVNEEIENAFGKVKEVTRQLKLQKSSGD